MSEFRVQIAVNMFMVLGVCSILVANQPNGRLTGQSMIVQDHSCNWVYLLWGRGQVIHPHMLRLRNMKSSTLQTSYCISSGLCVWIALLSWCRVSYILAVMTLWYILNNFATKRLTFTSELIHCHVFLWQILVVPGVNGCRLLESICSWSWIACIGDTNRS